MEKKKVNSFKFGKSFNLYAITDAHIGSKEHDKAKFDKLIDTIMNDPKGYCFFNGDNMEIIPPGYYISQEGQSMTVEEQERAFADLLKKLGRKVLFIRIGNHENRIFNLTGSKMLNIICEDLKIPVLGMGMELVKFTVEGRVIKIVSTHGEGGNSTKVFNNMQMTFGGADLYFMGHTHELLLNSSFQQVITDSGYEEMKPVHLVVGGSFSGWADYAREKNRRPTQVGCFVFNLSKDGIKVKQWEV